jgi:hypothetical protein
MAAAIYNLEIDQGSTLNSVVFVLDGDYTAWSPQGQIRTDYVSRGGILKAEFSFPPLVKADVALADGTVVNGTVVRPTLTSAQTGSLTPSSKKENWVYDLNLQNSNGEVMRFVQGRVTISPQVTV